MNISQNKINANELELKISLQKEDIQHNLPQVASDIGKDLEVPGFRKGKVPFEVIEQKFGQEYLYEEAAKISLKDAYANYIIEHKIDVVDQPEVNFSKFVLDGDVEFIAKVKILPEVDLPNYKKIGQEVSKEKKAMTVEDKELQDTLKYIVESRATYTSIDEPGKEGYIAEIDYIISKASLDTDNIIEKQEKYRVVIGQEPIFQELNKELIGLKKGDEKEITITFPSDYIEKDLQGTTAKMKIVVKDILEKKLPTLDDEFAKSLGEFENMSSLQNSIKDGILKEKENNENERIRSLILSKIREKIKIEPPESLVTRELDYMLEDIKHRIMHLGFTFEDYLKQINKTEDKIREELTKEAKQKVLDALIVREIVKRENIVIEPKELNDKINELMIALSYQVEDPTKINKESIKSYAQELCENEKVFDLLLKGDSKGDLK